MDDRHGEHGFPVQMGIKHKQGMPMQSQFEQAILDVYDFCIREKEAGVPIIPLNHFAKRVTEMLKISDSSVKRVLKKRENGIPLAPLKRKRNRKSPVTDVDDFTRDAIARKVHAYQYQDKNFTMGAFLEECRMDLGFKGCEKSLRRILEKQLGFEFKKIDNKLKIEQRKIKKIKGKPEVKHVLKVQTSPKKSNKPQVSVAIQTQTVQHQVQTLPIIDISAMRGQGMQEIGQVHSISVPRLHPMDDHTMQQQRQQQQQCGDTIEHMTIAGLVHHRGNVGVIENISLGHQQPRIQEMTVINDYRPKQEKY